MIIPAEKRMKYQILGLSSRVDRMIAPAATDEPLSNSRTPLREPLAGRVMSSTGSV